MCIRDRLRDHFIESVQRIEGVSVNGRTDHTNAPHVVSVSAVSYTHLDVYKRQAYVCTVATLEQTAREHNITKTAIVLVGDRCV